jgi:5-methylcytosine-specific restriction endonuclease McrA
MSKILSIVPPVSKQQQVVPPTQEELREAIRVLKAAEAVLEETLALGMKVCRRCGETKPTSEFYAREGLRDNLHIYCKKCYNGLSRDWGSRNPDRKRELRHEFNIRNSDSTSEYNRQYRTENHDRVVITVERWNEKNSERVKERKHQYNIENVDTIRAYGRKWRQENPERMRELIERWKEANPEQLRVIRRRANYKRRAILARVEFDRTIDIIDLYVRDAGICGICGSDCEIEYASIDHIKPISKMGPHTWDNIQLAHCRCNSIKNNKF